MRLSQKLKAIKNNKKICISGETSIFGIIGEPIQHSFSPAMQTVAFQKLKKENLSQVIPALLPIKLLLFPI